MEPINSSNTIILVKMHLNCFLYSVFSFVKYKTMLQHDIFKHRLMLNFKSVFKCLGRVTENFVIIFKRQPNYSKKIFFHIQ